MTYPWHYDESIQVGVDYRDPKEVEAYDGQMQGLRDPAADAKAIAAALALSKDSIVWEIGTGTGECGLALASACKQVYATDVSPAMLSFARKKAEQRRIHNVAFEVGGFLSGYQPEDSVDAIVSQLALHHLPDFWKARALETIVKKLRPKGRLFLKDVVFPSDIDDYDSFFRQFVEDMRARAGEVIAEETIQHIRAEYSTMDWILEGMLERAGLKILKKDTKAFLTAYLCER